MFRSLPPVVLCGVLASLVTSASAAPPATYEFKAGQGATYDLRVEVGERDRVIIWQGSCTYSVGSVEGGTAALQYQGNFQGTSRPKNAGGGEAAGGPRPFGGVSTSSTQSSFRVTPRGEVSGALRSPELPLPLGPIPALPIVVLPEASADRWETKTESELGLVSTLYQPDQNQPGMRPGFGGFGPPQPAGLAFEERLHLTETVTYAVKSGTAEFERTCAIASAEQVGGKPRIEFNSAGTVAFADDRFLPARVEWSGSFALRTGSGEVTSPVSVSARRLSAEELAERAAAAEQARLEAAAKLREDLGRLVEDLKSGDDFKARAAASRLDSDLADGNNAVVATALSEAYRAADDPWRHQFGRALVRWATAEQADLLIELVGQGGDVSTRRDAIKRLSELRIERAIPVIAGRLRDNFDRMAAVEALKKFGHAAEPAVIELLGHRDWSVRHQVIELLKTIGTGKSIGPLRKAAEDMNPLVKRSAEDAIKALEERLNSPIT